MKAHSLYSFQGEVEDIRGQMIAKSCYQYQKSILIVQFDLYMKITGKIRFVKYLGTRMKIFFVKTHSLYSLLGKDQNIRLQMERR